MLERYDRAEYFEPVATVARMENIRIARPDKKEFKPFTSTLSGAMMLGLYIGLSSLLFF